MSKPKTEREWCLYRAELSCKVGKDALDGKSPPVGVSAVEYACYNLFCAIEEVAKAMMCDANTPDQSRIQPSPEADCSVLRKRIAGRITEYLSLGGFFNPDHMEHDKVRDLLIECRECMNSPEVTECMPNSVINTTSGNTATGKGQNE